MKLKLEHLAPYLPYGLMVLDERDDEVWSTLGVDIYLGEITLYQAMSVRRSVFDFLNDTNSPFKPILRPLSDLFKLIDWDNNNDPYMLGYKYGIEKVYEDGIEFYAKEYYANYCESPKCYIDITCFDWWLFKHHFDVFGLIEQGLAIDKNTIL